MSNIYEIVSFILFVILFFVLLNFVFNVSELKLETKSVQSQITEIQQQLNLLKTTNHHKVILTAYHPPSKGINSDKNPKRTAIMKKPVPGYTLAISSDLVNQGWLGQKIYIEGWGVGKATDRMNPNIKGKRIDICFPTLKEAIKFGKKENILAVILN